MSQNCLTERVRKSIAKPYRLNAVCGDAGDQLQALAPGRSTPKLVLGDEVPARKKQGDPQHQPRRHERLKTPCRSEINWPVEWRWCFSVWPAFEEWAPGQQNDADHPAYHHCADDAVSKPNVAMRQARHFNRNRQLVEVNQIEEGFPETRRQQQCQAQDDDNSRCGLNKARP